jgi:hypothetical protein
MICVYRYLLYEISRKNALPNAFRRVQLLLSTSSCLTFMVVMGMTMGVSSRRLCFLGAPQRFLFKRRILAPRSSSPWDIDLLLSTACWASKNFDDLLNEVMQSKVADPSLVQTFDIVSKSRNGGWRFIDWNTQPMHVLQRATPSPVDTIVVRDRLVYIKRDDQVRCELCIRFICGTVQCTVLGLTFAASFTVALAWITNQWQQGTKNAIAPVSRFRAVSFLYCQLWWSTIQLDAGACGSCSLSKFTLISWK